MAPPGTTIGQIQTAPQQANTIQTVPASPTQLAQTQNTIATQPITMSPQQVPLPSTVQIKDDNSKMESPQAQIIPTQSVTPMEVQENGITEGINFIHIYLFIYLTILLS